MITKILIPILLAIVLPDIYLYRRFVRRCSTASRKRRRLVAIFAQSLLMLLFTVWLAASREFAPRDFSVMNAYLLLLSLFLIPKAVFTVCSLAGHVCSRVSRALRRNDSRRAARNYGNILGLLLVFAVWYIVAYGVTAGFSSVNVRHVEYVSPSLPDAFDGYRIVHFSDAHVGTYGTGRQDILSEFIDSINAQKADAIVFTGDLQNREPSEIYPHVDLLSSLKAKDGVFSVLGNHDYANYIVASPSEKVANERETMRLERQMGWRLLVNESSTVRRGNDSIVIAGMANDGDGRHFPSLGDIGATLRTVRPGAFVVMLQHDPSSWRRTILPKSEAQLTLSGHTHAMQFGLFGWSPASFVYDEWGGMYSEGRRAINVSIGMGGFIPFRFGMSGEIVVVELKKLKGETN